MKTQHIERCLFQCGGGSVPVLTWIDNVYVVGKSGADAIHACESLISNLQLSWRLTAKPGSTLVMLPKGSCEQIEDGSRWRVCEHMPTLGHIVSADRSIGADFESISRVAWRAFWSNPASKEARNVGINRQIRLFNACVTNSIAHVWSRWPPQKSIEKELDQLQNSMMSTLVPITRNPYENINSFICRRGRAAKALSKKAGLWSVEWETRAARWLGHLKRHPESPGGKVLAYHNMQWLRDRRAELLKRKNPKSLQYSLFSGWTDSRVLRGRPSPRFEEAVDASRTR